ncbi:MAG: hypothetical protein SFX74_03905 [Fimbriimonadaceae bacterium]|nr:hypothetical protein [Fimbriimonadaceae bacterium]
MSTSTYDPQATEEEASAKSQYMSRKELRIIGIGLIALAAICYPVYKVGIAKSEKAQCVGNFKAMHTALTLYIRDHDDGLPPVYRADDQRLPAIGENALPYTWHSDLFPYMSRRAAFACPSSGENERFRVENPEDGSQYLPASYGMYVAYSAEKYFNIELPDQTIILAETSNNGSESSYNPLPFRDKNGKPLPDGVTVGFDNDNFSPNRATKRVTRLAFRETGKSLKEAYGRHDGGIHALTATGELRMLQPDDSVVTTKDGIPQSPWQSPPRTIVR